MVSRNLHWERNKEISMSQNEEIKQAIRTIENFPSPGIRFYDIGPILADAALYNHVVRAMAEPLRGRVTKVVGFDARGFIFGGAVAHILQVGFVPLRKSGKLPGEVERVSYELEYGRNTLELQKGLLSIDDRVVLVDDVIATGGTVLAGAELVRAQGAEIVECCALVDLPNLGGSVLLEAAGVPVRTLIELGVE